MNSKVLVTGATGTVGSEVIKELAAKEIVVKAGGRDLDKVRKMLGTDVDPVLLDYDRPETFGPALVGVEHLFLLTLPLHPQNVEVAQGLVDEAGQAGVKRIVKLSVMGVDRNDTGSHREIEQYIEASGLAYTHLRANSFMQNFNLFYGGTIKEQGAFYITAGDAKVSFIDARDVGAAAAVVLAAEGHENKVYTLTGGKAIDHYEAASILSEVAGKEIKYVAMSDEDMRAGMQSQGVPESMIETFIGLYQLFRQGQFTPVTSDVSDILGRPPITFEQYAADYAGWWS